MKEVVGNGAIAETLRDDLYLSLFFDGFPASP